MQFCFLSVNILLGSFEFCWIPSNLNFYPTCEVINDWDSSSPMTQLCSVCIKRIPEFKRPHLPSLPPLFPKSERHVNKSSSILERKSILLLITHFNCSLETVLSYILPLKFPLKNPQPPTNKIIFSFSDALMTQRKEHIPPLCSFTINLTVSP